MTVKSFSLVPFAGLRILCLVFLFVAGAATAQVFKPVSSGQMADVNSQIIQPGDLHLKTLPAQLYETGAAPGSNKRVPQKLADVRMANMNRLDLPTQSLSILPRQNFNAKRACQSDQLAALPRRLPVAEILLTDPPPISQRVIRATTPKGEEELRDQLNKLPLQLEK